MKRVLLFGFLTCATINVWGQGLIINEKVRKAGIYKSFEEFKHNTPSLELKYGIVPKKQAYGVLSSEYVTSYHLTVDKNVGKSIGKVFGFSDGSNVYINDSLPTLGQGARFYQIHYFGIYSFYEGVSCETYVLEYIPTTDCQHYEKIIDIRTGNATRLSKKSLTEIIADDKVLLDEFDSSSKKTRDLKEFLLKYLERNKLSVAR